MSTKKIPRSLITITTINQIALLIAHYPTHLSELDSNSAVLWDAILEKTGGGVPILTDAGWPWDITDRQSTLAKWRDHQWNNVWERSVLILLDDLGLLPCP